MIRQAVLIAAALFADSASAKECNRFTRDTRPPGEIVAELKSYGRVLTITDQYTGSTTYDLMFGGTGVEAMDGTPREGSGTTDHVLVLKHKGDLLVDMAVYTPYCRKR